jgi:hypothetical protein
MTYVNYILILDPGLLKDTNTVLQSTPGFDQAAPAGNGSGQFTHVFPDLYFPGSHVKTEDAVELVAGTVIGEKL